MVRRSIAWKRIGIILAIVFSISVVAYAVGWFLGDHATRTDMLATIVIGVFIIAVVLLFGGTLLVLILKPLFNWLFPKHVRG